MEEIDPIKKFLELSQKITDKTSRSYHVRGIIISEVILLERIIDDYISRYFTSDDAKLKLMKEIVFGSEKMAFDNKRQIFYEILKVNNSDFLKKHSNFNKDLLYIIEKRNNVAHLILDIRNDKLDKEGFALVKHRNATSEVYLTEPEIENILSLISKSVELIIELIRADFKYDYYNVLRKLM
ncbi:MAG: hypothetical protein ACTHMI_13385 [Mucilaginibacter sp.]